MNKNTSVTITYEQFQKLFSVTKSLVAKYRLDIPVDYAGELEILNQLVKELLDSFDALI